MRYLPKSPAEREKMLAEIGAASIDDLFAVIPADERLTRDLDVPRQHAESEIIDYFRAAGAQERDELRQLSRRGMLSPLPAGHYRLIGAARRVSDELYALSGRDHSRHAAGHLRVSDHDCRADRHGRGQRQHVRRLDGRGRGYEDGHAHHRPGEGCRGRNRSSRISRGDGDLLEASGIADHCCWLR